MLPLQTGDGDAATVKVHHIAVGGAAAGIKKRMPAGRRGFPAREFYFPSAFVTARCVITPTRWARYSALAWMSAFIMLASGLRLSTDFALNRFPKASSAACQRKTP